MVYAPSNWNSRPCDLCTVILWPQRCIRRPTGSRSPRPPEVADAPPCLILSPLRHCLVVRWWADRGCIRQRVVGNRLQAPIVQPARSPFTLLPLCGTEEGQIDESQKTHAIQARNTKTSANILRRWTRPLLCADQQDEQVDGDRNNGYNRELTSVCATCTSSKNSRPPAAIVSSSPPRPPLDRS